VGPAVTDRAPQLSQELWREEGYLKKLAATLYVSEDMLVDAGLEPGPGYWARKERQAIAGRETLRAWLGYQWRIRRHARGPVAPVDVPLRPLVAVLAATAGAVLLVAPHDAFGILAGMLLAAGCALLVVEPREGR
jgi:hypothetical protein